MIVWANARADNADTRGDSEGNMRGSVPLLLPLGNFSWITIALRKHQLRQVSCRREQAEERYGVLLTFMGPTTQDTTKVLSKYPHPIPCLKYCLIKNIVQSPIVESPSQETYL